MVKKTTPRAKTTTRSRTTKPKTRTSTTTRKTTAKTPAKTAAKPVSVAPASAAAPVVEKVSLGKRQLIDRVVEASGIKKKAAKPVIEAVLKELGDALSRDETLNLQPFGKAIVKNRKELANAEIVELRLRRSKLAIKAAEAGEAGDAPTGPKDPLAEAAE